MDQPQRSDLLTKIQLRFWTVSNVIQVSQFPCHQAQLLRVDVGDMVYISQGTVWEDQFEELVKTTGDFGEKLPPGVKYSHHVLLRGHQVVLKFFPGEEVFDDVVVHIATGPYKDEITWSKSAIFQHTSQFPRSDDRHAARLAVVNYELMASLPISRRANLLLKFVHWHRELESVVDERFPGHQVRDID
jgi:hypothetical protein